MDYNKLKEVFDELELYKKAFKLACKAYENIGIGWFYTPGGFSIEDMFLKQAEFEMKKE